MTTVAAPREVQTKPTRARRLLLWLLLTVFSYGLIEATAWIGLEVLQRSGHLPANTMTELKLLPRHRKRIRAWIEPGGRYFTHSAGLGWTIKSNGAAHMYRSNSAGIRADREFDPEPGPGVIRIASFGDSFTHGSDSNLNETWQRQLETLEPSFEVLNLGVDAYGPGQSFLRYSQEGQRFQPLVVVIGFMSENINRSVSVFRLFYQPETGAPFTKPRFTLEDGELRLIPNPIPDVSGYQALLDEPEPTLHALGRHDHYFRIRAARRSGWNLPSVRIYRLASRAISETDPFSPGFSGGIYDRESEAYRVTEQLLDRFYAKVLEDGSFPIILVFPNKVDMKRYEQHEVSRYGPLVKHLERGGYAHIDLLAPLGHVTVGKLFRDGGHYSNLGNGIVAREVLEYLRSRGLDDGSAIERRVGEERARILGSNAAQRVTTGVRRTAYAEESSSR